MTARCLLLGLDVGSSFVKAALLDAASGLRVAAASSPAAEMRIDAPFPGWAEQDPRDWWLNVVHATREAMRESAARPEEVAAIGISYQMHGLVLVDREGQVLRPSIIWCDSRAVETGERAFEELGRINCFARLLNSPGNFTASKARWVKEHEPDVFARADKMLLPGDYVGLRMTGRAATTACGLSEAILWDYLDHRVSQDLLDVLGLDPSLVPEVVPTFGNQGELTAPAAGELGLRAGTPVAYRAGDQPNNAFSLRVLDPGEVAATAGTSGVVYGVGGQAVWDSDSRVNTFLHVTHTPEAPRFGSLLCVNGTGALNSWLRRALGGKAEGGVGLSYDEMNELAGGAPIGSDGVVVLPFGNGAERSLGNREPGVSIHGLSVVRHDRRHLLRAAQEGIVFALHHGMGIMREMGVEARTVRAGRANMFLSPLFARAFAAVSGATLELFETDGAQGAARGAGVGAGLFEGTAGAFHGLRLVSRIEPDASDRDRYLQAYAAWERALRREL
ncbi:MAG: carbohydrate kinase [Acidobacteria bacterium]|nr:MAG: carbohydrate kinase [Acidobacteriota bacterium]